MRGKVDKRREKGKEEDNFILKMTNI